MQEQLFGLSLLRWPVVEGPPGVGTGLEHDGFGGRGDILVLEVLLEERQFNLGPIERGGLRAEVDVAQLVAVTRGPAAVMPRPDHQHVLDLGVLPFDRVIRLERTVQVFGVVPPGDGHHRRCDVLQVRDQGALLPELVAVRVQHHLLPERDRPLQVELVDVLDGASLQEHLVAIGRRVDVGLCRFGRRFGSFGPVAGQPLEGMRQKERTVMQEVVEVPVANGSLWRDRLQRRMGVDHPGRRIEAGVRDAVQADSPVVMRHVL